MQNLKKQLAILAAFACMTTAVGCAESSDTESVEPAAESSASAEESSRTADSIVQEESLSNTKTKEASSAELTKADLNTEWGDDAVTLTFDGGMVTPSVTDGMTIENGAVTISKGGDYVLSGVLDDGRIVINLTDASEKVHLILNGLSVSCSTGSPLTVLQADKTIITLVKGTENHLTDAAEYTVFDIEDAEGNYPGACIASKDDLTINGEGTLTVSGNYNNGIHCADDLKIISGIITVTAANHGIRGNDSVLIHDGTIRITAGGDGIKSSNTEKEGKGYVLIEGGKTDILAQQDGIDAATALTVADGSLDITAGGGTANAAAHTGDMMGGGMNGGFGGRGSRGGDFGFGGGFDDASVQPTASYQITAAAAETSDGSSDSTKGIKADTVLTLSGGTVSINAADDGVHSNDTVQISGSAVLTVAAGDDGIHADSNVTITGGIIEITQSYEGIEAAEINVTDGEIRLYASDDGFNASDGSGSGGMGFNRNGSGEMNLSGGYIFVNADGDGLDSNGNITMTGGTVVVCGPTNDGNGSLDSGDNNNTITITGGTLIAVGSTGMMEVPEGNYLAATNLNASAGTLIVVTDADGKVLAALETPKQAQGIVVSANGMSDGYYIYTGGSYDGTLNADGFGTGGSYSGGTLIASGSRGGFGFGGGMMGGGRGGHDFRGSESDDMTPPDGFDGDMGGMTPPGGFGGRKPGNFS